jgi:hypothetical protein
VKVVVGMPWRPQPGRTAAHDYVRDWWEQHFPYFEVVEVDTAHEPYNLAAARNLAVHAAEKRRADVVVITDADTVVATAATIDRCVYAAYRDGRMHMPFRTYRYLTEAETADLYAGRSGPPTTGIGNANGGVHVVRPDAYWRAGGSDERFSGWGGDDDQLVAATTSLIGLRRHPGLAFSLWHPAVRDIGSERHRSNADLARRYWRAIRNPVAMRALIDERSA